MSAKLFGAADQALILIPNNSREYYARLEISTDGFGQVDIADLVGFDPMLRAEWSANIDDATATGSISFAAYDTMRNMRLSPLHTGSQGIIRSGREYELFTAVVPSGTGKPASGDAIWRSVLDGRVDNATVQDEDLVIEIRGPESWLLEDWINEDTKYGGANKDILQVMNDIAHDWLGIYNPFNGDPVNVIQLLLGNSPGFMINEYMQQKMPIWQAFRELALQIGWDVRYIKDGSRGRGKAYLYDPELGPDGTAPSFPISSGMFTEDGSIEINGDDVRNHVSGRYGNGLEAPPVFDADSINKYGRRPMWLYEDKTSNIDTEPEMLNMMQRALAQLKDPQVSFGANMEYYWPVQLNDRYIFAPDGYRTNQNLELVVSGFSHTLEDGKGTTNLRTRPVAACAFNDWLRSEPPGVYVSTTPPVDGTNNAKEGALFLVVDSVAFL